MKIEDIIEKSTKTQKIHENIIFIIKNRKHKDFISPSESKQIDYLILSLLENCVEEIFKLHNEERKTLLNELYLIKFAYMLETLDHREELFGFSEVIEELLDSLAEVNTKQEFLNELEKANKELKEIYV
ncbi:MAG: hypothetical protein WCK29_00330 [archaeon]